MIAKDGRKRTINKTKILQLARKRQKRKFATWVSQGGVTLEMLVAIANELNNVVFREHAITLHFEPNFDEENEEHTNFLLEEIISTLKDFLDDYPDEAWRLLDLDKRTQEFLRLRSENWHQFIEFAKSLPQLPWEIREMLDTWINDEIQRILKTRHGESDESCPADDPRYIRAKNQAINQVIGSLPKVEEYLKSLLVRQKREWPPKWIVKNKRIMQNLNRKGNRKFLKLYGLLRESKMKAYQARVSGADSWPVLVEVDYGRIRKETGLSKTQIRRYLRAMERWGIAKLETRRKHGTKVYSIGEWRKGKSPIPRPLYFLKNTAEMRHALEKFDANFMLKKKGTF